MLVNLPVNLQQSIDSIRLKYDIKREYFTVGIPVIIALLLVLFAYITGHTLSLFSSTSGQTAVDDKQKALEELIKQMGEEGGATTTTTTETPIPVQTPDLDHYIIFAAIIAMTPYAIDRYLQRREKKRNEEDFTQFLFKMSELMRAGIDPIKSVVELSRTEMGSLSKHINLAASAMIIGSSFDDGMRRVSKSLDSELITKYIDLIVQASNTGGSVHNLILKASEDMRAMIMIDREMEGNLKQYVLIFYFAQVVLIVMVYILSTQMFPFLSGTGMQQIFGGAGIADINYQQGFFHMLIINGMIGGIIIGKITEGSAKDGLKHSVILTIVSYLACVLIIIPASSGVQVTINVVSGDQQTGLATAPLQDPIVFQVLDTNGLPVTGTTVSFSITPSGNVTPSYDVTDVGGNVSVKVLLGDIPGTYTVNANVDKNVKSATVIATSE